MSAAQYAVDGAVAVIRLDNPPMNTLAHALREALVQQLARAAADGAVKAVVLAGAGRAFCAGAEIREFNTPKSVASPNLRELIAAIEALDKPVVAAIHGVAMGGGLELALGCHYRVAAPGAQLALPEVKLGLIPGAGGTQRLPRALGVGRALGMIVSGEPVKSEQVAGTGLVDEIIAGELVPGAVGFAERIAARRPLRRLRDLSVTPDAVAFAEARKKVAKEQRGYPAPARAVEAIEGATTLAFDDGVRNERLIFDELVLTPESKALRHAFFGERAVAKVPDVPEDTPTIDVRRVAVVGAGTMGGGIAMAFANAGFPVTVLETSREALERGLATVRRNYAGAVARGRLAQGDMDARLARIGSTLSYDDLRDADLVIEAVFEDMRVKKDVFAALDRAMKPGAILATNTSTLDVDEIAAATSRPESVIGLHFFSPANVMRLLEIVRAKRTSKPVLATALKLARTIRKLGVVSGVCDGFIGNRMVEQYLRQAGFLLDEGALPHQVDRALQEWGMAMGPFAMSDLAGNDIGWAIRKRRRVERPDFTYSAIPDRICELGRFGQKTGAGFYRYEPGGRAPIPDPEIDKLIVDHSRAIGVERRTITDAEIVERCIYALVNEGARILEEGIAMRAVDIDMVYIAGYGFPPYRGGPMFYADTVGLDKIVAAIESYARGYRGESWEVAPRLARLAREGRTFN
ncbi:MAG TPA: 3-hydroxyacyl-CoA dehydrogenase NAD-binding domain-containing protein [Burkholderiales bacterium]